MKYISIFIAKIAAFIGNLIGRGSSMPGLIAQKIDKNIFKKFVLPKKVIVVTGSSGKGSTSKIIADTYKDLGYSVAHNEKGGNLPNGIITTLVSNSKLNGKVKKDIVVLEIDERYLKEITPFISPTDIVVTNITRDQPPRHGNTDIVLADVIKGINKDATLYLNANDPQLQKFDNEKIVYYEINKLKNSYLKNLFTSLNQARCPKCNSILKYDYYHIEDIGKYKCSNDKCSFKTPEAKCVITKFKDNIITIDNKYEIILKNDMLYSFYNTLAAYTVLVNNKLDPEKVSKSISSQNKNTKLHNIYKYNNRDVHVLNNKCENASTYNQSMLYAYNDKKLKTIVLGWAEISRRYIWDDISWLYDVEFEILKENTDTFIVAGPQRYDLANRLKYAGIEENKIKISKDLYEAKDYIKNSKGSIYAILNFDYLNDFNNVMEELK